MNIPMEADSKTRAAEAFRILNEFIGDLVSSTSNLELLDTALFQQADIEVKRAYFRMCISYLMISLSKWCEFYEKYHSVIPRDVRIPAQKLKIAIEQRGIIKFRNKVVGHIWDKELKRPLTIAEVQTRLIKIYGDSPEKFVLWINDSQKNTDHNTVVGIVEYVRDRIRQEFDLSENDIFPPELIAELSKAKRTQSE